MTVLLLDDTDDALDEMQQSQLSLMLLACVCKATCRDVLTVSENSGFCPTGHEGEMKGK